MCKQYDTSQFGYDVYSKRIRLSEVIKDKDAIQAMLAQWGIAFVYQMLDGYQITVKFIEECTGAEYNEAKMGISKLLRNGCITKKHNFYIKTPSFIKLLKEFTEDPKLYKEDF